MWTLPMPTPSLVATSYGPGVTARLSSRQLGTMATW